MAVSKPIPSSHFHDGRKAFEREEWNVAIRSFHEAIEADRHHAESYIGLIKAYEAAFEESEDAAHLERAARICREAKRLHLDERQRAILDEAADRIVDSLKELRDPDV